MSDRHRPSALPRLYSHSSVTDQAAPPSEQVSTTSAGAGVDGHPLNIERLHAELQAAHCRYDLARMEIEAIQKSIAFRLVERARRVFESLLPSTGRPGALRAALRNACDVWLDEGLVTLGTRTVSKVARVCARMVGAGSEGRRIWAARKRDRLIRAISTGRERPSGAYAATRSLTEIGHILGRDCQRCSHFEQTSCALVRGSTPAVRQSRFHELLLERDSMCPVGIWPGRTGAPIARRNLVYFIFPLRHPEGVWQWNVAQLLQRLSVFNGRRIVTVATAPGNALGNGRFVDPPEAVVEAFAGHNVEFRFVQNDRRGQEAPHFLAAMREVASTDPAEAVFYAHAKGVTRPIVGGEAIRNWTAAMYHHNLDRSAEVCDLLRRWPCVGIAKKYGYPVMFVEGRSRRSWGEGNRPWYGWHYAGTFWWARHDALFSRPDWDQIEIFAYATEKYLANFFRADEAFCLAYDDCARPYDAATWRESGVDRPIIPPATAPRAKAA